MSDKKFLIVIGGATATGKTKVSIQLAQRYGAEILSCDSRQFYREITIGTAKPSTNELSAAKHHFINSLSIEDEYTVGNYEKDALDVLSRLFDKTNYAIMVGGSGLFIRAVCEGLDEFPDVPESITQQLQYEYEQHGLPQILEELKEKDPSYFQEVDVHNSRRVLRALGVIRASHQPFSSFRKNKKQQRFFTPIYVQIDMDRGVLYERINQRVDLMMKAGLLEEARELYDKRHLKSLQTVGYQEFFEYFGGHIDLETAIELVKRNSRRYAKRQGTWFRRDGHWKIFQHHQVEEIIGFIDSFPS